MHVVQIAVQIVSFVLSLQPRSPCAAFDSASSYKMQPRQRIIPADQDTSVLWSSARQPRPESPASAPLVL